MAPDAKRFHAVPNGRRDSRSSMLHPAAPHDQAHRQQPRTEHTPEPFYQPSNMEALRRSIDEMQQGKTVTKTLEELTALEDD